MSWRCRRSEHELSHRSIKRRLFDRCRSIAIHSNVRQCLSSSLLLRRRLLSKRVRTILDLRLNRPTWKYLLKWLIRRRTVLPSTSGLGVRVMVLVYLTCCLFYSLWAGLEFAPREILAIHFIRMMTCCPRCVIVVRLFYSDGPRLACIGNRSLICRKINYNYSNWI